MSSGFSYLKDDIQEEIKKIAKHSLEEVLVKGPPVSIEPLYDSKHLQRQLFDKDDHNFIKLSESIGEEKADSLRGVLFVDKSLVVVRDDGYAPRTNFVFGHEFGHWIIPWHKQMLYKCTQFDLSAAARKQMEREANFFTSELLFMGEKFTESLFYKDLSLSNIKKLATVFGMSKEATLRRAVELEHRPCAFLSLVAKEDDAEKFLTIKYAVHSQPFRDKVGRFNQNQTFSDQHEISKIFTDPIKRMANNHEFIAKFGEKKIELKAEVWFNGYNVLAFFQLNE